MPNIWAEKGDIQENISHWFKGRGKVFQIIPKMLPHRFLIRIIWKFKYPKIKIFYLKN